MTMFCNATGRPTAQLTWIRVKDGVRVAYGNLLTIRAADRSYRGEYRCEANNGVGQPASKSAYLDVLCKFVVALLVCLFALKERSTKQRTVRTCDKMIGNIVLFCFWHSSKIVLLCFATT